MFPVAVMAADVFMPPPTSNATVGFVMFIPTLLLELMKIAALAALALNTEKAMLTEEVHKLVVGGEGNDNNILPTPVLDNLSGDALSISREYAEIGVPIAILLAVMFVEFRLLVFIPLPFIDANVVVPDNETISNPCPALALSCPPAPAVLLAKYIKGRQEEKLRQQELELLQTEAKSNASRRKKTSTNNSKQSHTTKPKQSTSRKKSSNK